MNSLPETSRISPSMNWPGGAASVFGAGPAGAAADPGRGDSRAASGSARNKSATRAPADGIFIELLLLFQFTKKDRNHSRRTALTREGLNQATPMPTYH